MASGDADAVLWRGPAAEAAAPLSDLVAAAVVLACRGKLATTLSVEPAAGGELVAALRVVA